ncbi:hypothetical protein GCM10020258_07080 [Sphingomonas yabuuchiae]
MRLALHEPDIAGNVGTLIRTATCFGVAVDLIEPMGFPYSDRALARSAMDYAAMAEVMRHADWDAFRAATRGRIVLATTLGAIPLPEMVFHPDDVILLGSEGLAFRRRCTTPPISGCACRCAAASARSTSRSPAGFCWPRRGARPVGTKCPVDPGPRPRPERRAMNSRTPDIALDAEQDAARLWFESLRDRICAEFEAIEREAGSDAAFQYTAWDRADPSGEPGGGGMRGVMKGRVFEKVGVNVSTVGGTFEGHSPRPSTALATIRVSWRRGSAWSRIWPTRMCQRSI